MDAQLAQILLDHQSLQTRAETLEDLLLKAEDFLRGNEGVASEDNESMQSRNQSQQPSPRPQRQQMIANGGEERWRGGAGGEPDAKDTYPYADNRRADTKDRYLYVDDRQSELDEESGWEDQRDGDPGRFEEARGSVGGDSGRWSDRQARGYEERHLQDEEEAEGRWTQRARMRAEQVERESRGIREGSEQLSDHERGRGARNHTADSMGFSTSEYDDIVSAPALGAPFRADFRIHDLTMCV